MSDILIERVTVLGGGGWGTALAVHLARLGKHVKLWARDENLVTEMMATRVNRVYLGGVKLPALVQPINDLELGLKDAQCVVSAVPSHGTRDVIRRAEPFIPLDAVIISAAKGLEEGTLFRMTAVIEEELGTGHPVVVLSGPSFSLELARELPTAVSVASHCAEAVAAVQHGFRSRYFRLYATEDVVGVEIGGAMKNVIAIAAGVIESLGLGDNARSALITRGLTEISRLAVAVGGRRETLSGLSGLGDLVLTCTGRLSRNRSVGIELGKGNDLSTILSEMKAVAEGVRTTDAALALGLRYGVELPITSQMADVLTGRKEPRVAVEDLMLRRQRSEVDVE
jgi:glycerol-3-phosphate dehydrogenase (NAD(P)+)